MLNYHHFQHNPALVIVVTQDDSHRITISRFRIIDTRVGGKVEIRVRKVTRGQSRHAVHALGGEVGYVVSSHSRSRGSQGGPRREGGG